MDIVDREQFLLKLLQIMLDEVVIELSFLFEFYNTAIIC